MPKFNTEYSRKYLRCRNPTPNIPAHTVNAEILGNFPWGKFPDLLSNLYQYLEAQECRECQQCLKRWHSEGIKGRENNRSRERKRETKERQRTKKLIRTSKVLSIEIQNERTSVFITTKLRGGKVINFHTTLPYYPPWRNLIIRKS